VAFLKLYQHLGRKGTPSVSQKATPIGGGAPIGEAIGKPQGEEKKSPGQKDCRPLEEATREVEHHRQKRRKKAIPGHVPRSMQYELRTSYSGVQPKKEHKPPGHIGGGNCTDFNSPRKKALILGDLVAVKSMSEDGTTRSGAGFFFCINEDQVQEGGGKKKRGRHGPEPRAIGIPNTCFFPPSLWKKVDDEARELRQEGDRSGLEGPNTLESSKEQRRRPVS